MWLVFYFVSKHLERYEKYGTVYIEVFEKYVKYVRIRINAHMNVDNVFIQKYAHIWLPDPPNVWYLGVQYSDQAPAIISLQIENDKFIEKNYIVSFGRYMEIYLIDLETINKRWSIR